MEPLPIESNTAEIILSQYSVEHIPDTAAAHFFREAHRALKTDGTLRVVTPNADLDLFAYKNRDLSSFFWIPWMSTPKVYQQMGYRIPLNQASLEQIILVHFAANASTIHVGGNQNQITDEEFREVMDSMPKEDALDYCTSRCSVEIQKKYRTNHMNWWTPE